MSCNPTFDLRLGYVAITHHKILKKKNNNDRKLNDGNFHVFKPYIFFFAHIDVNMFVAIHIHIHIKYM